MILFLLFGIERKSVLVSGFVENVDQEFLEMFFENEERSGGGKIENILLDSKSPKVLITFADSFSKCSKITSLDACNKNF